MTDAIRNNVSFGVQNEEFEMVGAGSVDRFGGEDGLLAGVARAAKVVLAVRQGRGDKEQAERAEALLQARVDRLFDEFEGDASAIASATGFRAGDMDFSYNSLHISVRNPNYIAPVATHHEVDGVYSGTTWDWSHARGTEFRDVTRTDVMANPQLGTELVMHNDFHL